MLKNISLQNLVDGLGLKKSDNGNFPCINKSAHSNGDNNASMSINITNGLIGYNCFRCGVSGNPNDLVANVLGISIESAREWIDKNALQNRISSYESQNEAEKKSKKLHVRYINKRNERYFHPDESTLSLRNVTDDDLTLIFQNLGKLYTKEAFKLTRTKIHSFIEDKDYSIVFSDCDFIKCKSFETDVTIYFEGRSDFLTAVSVGLHNHYNIGFRFNVTKKFIVKTDIIYTFLDSDDTESNIVTRIKNFENKQLYCVYPPTGIKDFSDYIYTENLWDSCNEIVTYIENNLKKLHLPTLKSNQSNEDEKLVLFSSDFNKTLYQEHITKNGKPIDEEVCKVFKAHSNLVYICGEKLEGMYFFKDGYWQKIHENVVKKDIKVLISNVTVKKVHLQSIYDLLKIHINLDERFLEQSFENHYLINGVLLIGNYSFSSHSKDNFNLGIQDFAYNPDAKAPIFERFLNECTNGDIELKNHLLESLAKSFSFARSGERIIWIYGNGNNGKSVITKLMSKLFPAEQTLHSFDISKLNEPFYVGNLRGKRLVVSGDANPYINCNASILKSVTGNDIISANVKYKDPIEFEFLGMILMASNALPKMKDLDSLKAIYRRLTIIPFFHVPDKDDPELFSKLLTERSGILNLMIEAHKRLKENSFELTKSSIVEQEKSKFVINSNPVIQFLVKKGIDLTTCKLESSELYLIYKEFMKNEYSLNEKYDFKGNNSLSSFEESIFKLKGISWLWIW